MPDAADSLQIHDDPASQRREWRVERVAWTLMTLLLLAALLGAFGGGPLSRARAAADGVSVDYERFQRRQSPDAYYLALGAGRAARGALRVRIDQPLIDAIELDRIEPEPEHSEGGAGFVDYVFPPSTAHVTFRFRPARTGRVHGHLTVDGAPPLAISSYVYP